MYVQTNWKCIINREIEEIEIDKGYTINKKKLDNLNNRKLCFILDFLIWKYNLALSIFESRA